MLGTGIHSSALRVPARKRATCQLHALAAGKLSPNIVDRDAQRMRSSLCAVKRGQQGELSLHSRTSLLQTCLYKDQECYLCTSAPFVKCLVSAGAKLSRHAC